MLETFRIVLGAILAVVLFVALLFALVSELIISKGGCFISFIRSNWVLWLMAACAVAAWALVGFFEYVSPAP